MSLHAAQLARVVPGSWSAHLGKAGASSGAPALSDAMCVCLRVPCIKTVLMRPHLFLAGSQNGFENIGTSKQTHTGSIRRPEYHRAMADHTQTRCLTPP